MLIRFKFLPLALVVLALTLALPAACASDGPTLNVYSSRFDTLVEPLVHRFAQETGIEVEVKYASNVETAARILEEGDETPADVVFLYDPSYLGGLSKVGILSPLPRDLLERVDPRFRSRNHDWVGTSGRSRTIVFNTSAIDPGRDLPDSITGFADPAWNGRIGWPPGDGSFHAFLTAFRMQSGDDAARRWLQDIQANNPVHYPNNTAMIMGVASGEVDVGFSNHYYLQRHLDSEGPSFGARNHFLGDGDPGALVLVAGAGILASSENAELGQRFIEYLLSGPVQRYMASQTTEYPLVAGVPLEGDLPPLESLDPPDIDLGELTGLQETLAMLRDVGVLPDP